MGPDTTPCPSPVRSRSPARTRFPACRVSMPCTPPSGYWSSTSKQQLERRFLSLLNLSLTQILAALFVLFVIGL